MGHNFNWQSWANCAAGCYQHEVGGEVTGVFSDGEPLLRAASMLDLTARTGTWIQQGSVLYVHDVQNDALPYRHVVIVGPTE